MSFFKKLFGGAEGRADSSKVEPVDYNGFLIFPEPVQEGSTYRIAARIEKVVNGELKTQVLMRADTINDPDKAAEMSAAKARQVIDERDDQLFDLPRA